MGDSGVLVHKEQERQVTPLAPSASLSSWALDTVAATRGALGSVRAAAKAHNPLLAAQKWVVDKQEAFGAWLSQQPVAVEAAVSTGLAALQGAAAGGLVSTLNKDLARSFEASAAQHASMGLDPNAMKNPFLAESLAVSPVIQARNFAVLTGVNAGISSVLKRLRGVDDLQNSLTAAFGSGFVFQLVSSAGPPNVVNAVGTGAFFAVLQGGIHKASEMMSKPKEKGATAERPTEEDIYYPKARRMLLTLGLGRYVKNFREGLLTDATLPLVTESALKEVRIPPGPRLVILDYIQRDPELMTERRSR